MTLFLTEMGNPSFNREEHNCLVETKYFIYILCVGRFCQVSLEKQIMSKTHVGKHCLCSML